MKTQLMGVGTLPWWGSESPEVWYGVVGMGFAALVLWMVSSLFQSSPSPVQAVQYLVKSFARPGSPVFG